MPLNDMKSLQFEVLELPFAPNPAEIESPTRSILLERGVGARVLPSVIKPKKTNGFL
jgi:hypothetical protein